MAEDAEADIKPNKASKLGAIAVPLVAFLAATGASFALSSNPAPAQPITASDAPSAVTPMRWAPPEPAKTVTIEPIVVTFGERNSTLKLGIAIELTDAEMEADTPRLRDAFTGYLRTVGPRAATNPGFHSQLKRQLLHRARVVFGPDAVTDVLITDFMITG